MPGPDSLPGFLHLVRTELDLELTDQDAETELAALPGWDSMNLLRLVTLLESGSGRRLPVPNVLAARNLREIYAVLEEAA
jgi:acyl carrier protein